jgi:C1A family cysteine protease
MLLVVSVASPSSAGQTGLRPPTPDEIRWEDRTLIPTHNVKPGKLSLARLQAERAAAPMATREVSSTACLPSAVDNSTLPSFPPVRDQGPLSSCACFSSTYYALTHMRALATGDDAPVAHDTSRQLSPKWTYNFVNDGTDAGSWITTAYAILLKHGAASWSEFPYDDNYREWSTDPNVWRRAIGRRADQVGFVGALDTAEGLNDLKQMLANGYVLNFATYVRNWQWKTLTNDPATHADDATAGKPVCFWVNGSEGSHAMTVVGYDDTAWTDVNANGRVDAGEKGALKIVNSWGTSWGTEGCAWFAYDALKATSAVTGAPGSGRVKGWWFARAYWITAKAFYEPRLLARFTVSHAKRAQMSVYLGLSDPACTGSSSWWLTSAFDHRGGACAFDGSTTPRPTTFYLDFADLSPPVGESRRYHILVSDRQSGDAAVLEDYRLIDTMRGGREIVCADTPLTADAAAVCAYVEYTCEDSDVIFVDAAATGGGDGSSWGDACGDLQGALRLARAGSRVWVAGGVYVPGACRSDSFRIGEMVAVYGGFAGDETSLDERDLADHASVLSGDIGRAGDPGDNSYHVVVMAASSILDGFVVRGGNADGPGRDAVGGGVQCAASSVSIRNCRIIMNAASLGGGLHAGLGSLDLTNCVFWRNRAAFGGAVCVFNTDLALVNCTVAANAAEFAGSALYYDASRESLANCIVWGNTTGLAAEELHGSGSLPLLNHCCIVGGDCLKGGEANIDAEPQFVNPEGGDMRLQPLSPCIDAADTLVAPVTDATGNARMCTLPVDVATGEDAVSSDTRGDETPSAVARADMGAFEFTGTLDNAAPRMDSVEPQDLEEGQTLVLTLSATDPDGDDVAFAAGQLPEGATLDAHTGRFVWTPTWLQDGTCEIVFVAIDANCAADRQTVAIVVHDVDGDADADGIRNADDDDDDNDGLDDLEEMSFGTNPLLADTDGDGFTDAEEIAGGTCPLDASYAPGVGLVRRDERAAGCAPPAGGDDARAGLAFAIAVLVLAACRRRHEGKHTAA